jgi:hypothetical protein
MLKYKETDDSYVNKLRDIGIVLLQQYQGAKKHHEMKCMSCGHEWTATPISKIHNYKKWGSGGCPLCTQNKNAQLRDNKRQQNIQLLKERGIEILSDWNGQYVQNIPNQSVPVSVVIKNVKCGHIFTTSSKNLLSRNVNCPICNKEERVKTLNSSSIQRSDEWKKTASEWKIYKSAVTNLTRVNYKLHRNQINPNNLQQGKAGMLCAHHLDHIVPIRYCFNNNIPIDLCAHQDNLQILGWRENVGSRDKLKSIIPHIFNEYIVSHK